MWGNGILGGATHFPILAGAVARTQGPILELGAGHFSTPMLHMMCLEKNRRLVTVEGDPEWLKTFKILETPWHEFHHMKIGREDDFTLIDEADWAVVLVDHRPASRRIREIERLKDRAIFIVVHDTEDERAYHYESTLAKFTYRTDWKAYRVWTSVVSMRREFVI